MSLIQFRGVQKSFGPKQVYRHLDLAIAAHEVRTIIGGSGQGKSVMLKMLVGLLPVDKGTIQFDGKIISGRGEAEFQEVRKRIAMLFQGAALFDSMSVEEKRRVWTSRAKNA